MDTVELLEGVEILSVSEAVPLVAVFFALGLCLLGLVLIIYLIVTSLQECFLGVLFLSLPLLCIIGISTWVILDEGFDPTLTYLQGNH